MSRKFKNISEIEKILHLPKYDWDNKKIRKQRSEILIKALEKDDKILEEYKI